MISTDPHPCYFKEFADNQKRLSRKHAKTLARYLAATQSTEEAVLSFLLETGAAELFAVAI